MTISSVAAYAGALCFTGAIVWAAAMDIYTMKIRNELVVLVLAAYAVLAPFAGFGVVEISLSIAVAFVVLIAGFISFSLGWIGGGDAKLASAVALWIGANHTLEYLLYTALFGGALTLLTLQFRSLPLPYHVLRVSWITRLHDPDCGIPYGLAIAAGAILILPDTLWMAAS